MSPVEWIAWFEFSNVDSANGEGECERYMKDSSTRNQWLLTDREGGLVACLRPRRVAVERHEVDQRSSRVARFRIDSCDVL